MAKTEKLSAENADQDALDATDHSPVFADIEVR